MYNKPINAMFMDSNTEKERDFMGRTIYEPIRKKVEEWLWYDENQPSGNYFANVEEHDRFRSLHDRDCMLTGGDLKADTLFSLWTPLRHTIVRLNDRETIRSVGDIAKKYVFLALPYILGNNAY